MVCFFTLAYYKSVRKSIRRNRFVEGSCFFVAYCNSAVLYKALCLALGRCESRSDKKLGNIYFSVLKVGVLKLGSRLFSDTPAPANTCFAAERAFSASSSP